MAVSTRPEGILSCHQSTGTLILRGCRRRRAVCSPFSFCPAERFACISAVFVCATKHRFHRLRPLSNKCLISLIVLPTGRCPFLVVNLLFFSLEPSSAVSNRLKTRLLVLLYWCVRLEWHGQFNNNLVRIWGIQTNLNMSHIEI